jgi:hypothetical protein
MKSFQSNEELPRRLNFIVIPATSLTMEEGSGAEHGSPLARDESSKNGSREEVILIVTNWYCSGPLFFFYISRKRGHLGWLRPLFAFWKHRSEKPLMLGVFTQKVELEF